MTSYRSSNKRILFLNANLQAGGAERQMVTVARLLKRRGHDVSFYCYGQGDFYAFLLKEDSIPVVWSDSRRCPLKSFFRIRRYVKKGCFDTVVSFMTPSNFINEVISFGGKTWRVVTGLRFCPDSQDRNVKDRVFNWFRGFSDVVVSNSERAAAAWKYYHPKSVANFKVIYNYVDLGIIHSHYRPKYDGRLHIIVAASFQFLKNSVGLAKALSMMSVEERMRIVVDWYGSGHDSECFNCTKNMIRENGLEDVFILHEATREIYERMNESDVVMLLSHIEGFPNAICEGMSLGKPIIMTQVSDYNAMVDETNGFLCDADDPESIKIAIIQMTLFPIEVLLKMGACSSKKAKHLFSSDSITSLWEQIC